MENTFFSPDSFFKNNLKSLGKSPKNLSDMPTGMPPVIRAIYIAANNGVDLGSCIAAIGSISQYLSYDNKLVQAVAAQVIAILVGRAAKYMQKIDNPAKIQTAGKFLLDIIEKLQSLPTIGGNVKSNLDTISKFIKTKMEKSKEKDEFIKTAKKEFDKLKSDPAKKEKFAKLLGIQEKDLEGNINFIEYKKFLSESLNNLIKEA